MATNAIHRRTRFEVAADILRVGVASKSQLFYSSGLSHELFNKYLAKLIELGFIEIAQADRPAYYATTDKGILFYTKIDALAETFPCL